MKAVDAMDCDANFHTLCCKIVQNIPFKHKKSSSDNADATKFLFFPPLAWNGKLKIGSSD